MAVRWLVAGGVALVAAIAVAPAPAAACTWLSGITRVVPEDGATDVPTDIVPWAHGIFLGDGWRVELRPEGGDVLPIEVTQLGRVPYEQLEIWPSEELAPFTRYTLTFHEGASARAQTVTFETGAGPTGEAPTRTSAGDIQTVDSRRTSSCGPGMVSCVSLDGRAEVVEIALVRDGDVFHREIQRVGDAARIWWGSTLESDFCVEVRSRDPAGRRAEPSRICSDDGARFSVSPPVDEYPAFSCNGVVVSLGGEPASRLLDVGGGGGCAAVPARSGAWAWVALALLALRVRRRRPCRDA